MSSPSVFLASFSLSLNSVLCTQVLNFSSLFSFLPPASHPPAYRLSHLLWKKCREKQKQWLLTLDPSERGWLQSRKRQGGYSPRLAAELPRGLSSFSRVQRAHCQCALLQGRRKSETKGPKVWTLAASGQSRCSGLAALAASCPANHTGCEYWEGEQESRRVCPKRNGLSHVRALPRRSSRLHTTLVPRTTPHCQRAKGAATQDTWQHQNQSSGQPTEHGRQLTHRAPIQWACTSQTSSHTEGAQLTMSTHACFPSMKPLGMEFGVRISYLRKKREAGSIHPLLQFHMAGNIREKGPSLQCSRRGIPFTKPKEMRHSAYLNLLFS